MSDRRIQRSAGDDTFSQNPNTQNADESGNVPELRLVVGSPSHGVSRDGTDLPERRVLPDLPNLSNQIRPHQAARNYRTPNHREPHSVIQQRPTRPAVLPYTDQAGMQQTAWTALPAGVPSAYTAGRQPMAENYPLLPPAPQSGPQSGVWNFGVAPWSRYRPRGRNFEPSSSSANGPHSRLWNFAVAPSHSGLGSGAWNSQVPPSPSPTTNRPMTLMDEVLQSGPRFLGPNSNTPRTFISQFGHFYGGPGVAHSPESFSADINRNHMALLELRQSVQDDPQVVALRAEATPFNPFQPSLFMGSVDMNEDMSSDTDSTSSEDWSDFEEQLENANGGLTEETITELLKKRNYECATHDPCSDPETCCICIDAYAHGEEIGMLICGHEFHSKCIRNWLLIKNDCPICKSKGLDV